MRLKNIFRLLLLLLFLIVPSFVYADNIKGRVLDAETKEPLPMASVEARVVQANCVYMATAVADSLGNFTITTSGEGRITLVISMIGYNSTTKRGYSMGGGTSNTIKLGDILLKPTELMMKDVVITARAKRFSMKGDTIVFHPEAFKLREGARLDELIKRLPGVVEKDGKLYWNNKPLRMMMNGKDILGGGSMLAQLPAEAVQNIKSYNKKSDEAIQTGSDNGKDDQVLDVKIKPGFMDKWYGDVTTRWQPSKYYWGTFETERLSDKDPILVSLDANNLCRYQERGLGWGSWGNYDAFGKAQSAAVGWQHNWKQGNHQFSDKNNYNIAINFNHKDGWGTTFTTEQITHPETAEKTWGLVRESHYEHAVTPKLQARLFTYTDSLNSISGEATFEYNYLMHNGEESSAQMNNDPKLFGDFPIDQALLATTGADIYHHLINRQQVYTQQIEEGAKGSLYFGWNHFLGKKGMFAIAANAELTGGTNRYNTHRQLDYITESISSPLYQQYRLPSHGLDTYIYSKFDYNITKIIKLAADYTFRVGHKKEMQDFYSSSSKEIQDTNLASTKDNANSYDSKLHSTTHTLNLGFIYKNDKWQVIPNIRLDWIHSKLDYQRGTLDTLAVRNNFFVSPNLKVKWNISDKNGLEYNFSYTSKQPTILSTLGYYNTTNPLLIEEGNPLLHQYHTYSNMLTYQQTWAKQQAMLMLKAGYTKNINPLTTVYYYNPTTGVYRSHQENVRGGDDWMANMVFDKGIGDDFHFSAKVESHLMKSYGYFSALDETQERALNRLNQFTFKIDPEFVFERERLVAKLFGAINLQKNKYQFTPDYNSTPMDYTYGMSILWKPRHWEVGTDIKNEARKGYLMSEFNRNNWLWDASAKWLFWKNKGSLMVEFDDILNQRAWRWSMLTANKRSESWEESIHHYVRFTFAYHFDAKGKK